MLCERITKQQAGRNKATPETAQSISGHKEQARCFDTSGFEEAGPLKTISLMLLGYFLI